MSHEAIADLVRRAHKAGEMIARQQWLKQRRRAAQHNSQPHPEGLLTAHTLDDTTIRRLASTTTDPIVRKICNSALHSQSTKVRRRMRGRIATILNAMATAGSERIINMAS